MMQEVYDGNIYDKYKEIVVSKEIQRVFIVCGKTVSQNQRVQQFLQDDKTEAVFQNFNANPTYDSVVEAIKCFRQSKCDAILAIGGGSAIDVAKGIKAFLNVQNLSVSKFENSVTACNIPIIAIPTTAGAGSEATKFAVIYYQNEKKSVVHESLVPSVVLFNPSFLYSLPLYQKKATMLDALCHAIESYWSKHATEQSKLYSRQAIQLVLNNYKGYLKNEEKACITMQKGAYIAGKAINITTTTAAHALSYKLTTRYSIAHGHAVAICLLYVWKCTFEIAKQEENEALLLLLESLADILGTDTIEKSIEKFTTFLNELEIESRVIEQGDDLELLVRSVNVERLENHPVFITEDIIRNIYSGLLITQ